MPLPNANIRQALWHTNALFVLTDKWNVLESNINPSSDINKFERIIYIQYIPIMIPTARALLCLLGVYVVYTFWMILS